MATQLDRETDVRRLVRRAVDELGAFPYAGNLLDEQIKALEDLEKTLERLDKVVTG